MPNVFRRATSAAKAFAMRFSSWGRGWRIYGHGRTYVDYGREVGDGRGNAIVEACIGWVARTFPEAPIRISTRASVKDDWSVQPEHALVDLIDTPNPYYSGELLWMATLADWMADGNSYWLKIRSGAGRPVQLWWVPHTMIQPKWPDDGSVFISHYEYTPDTEPIRVDVADVVHFRYGLDPENPRKGCSPLKSLAREIFTDDEAANFSASLLRNLGVPGVVISPAEDVRLEQEDADQIKSTFEQRFSRDNVGRALVMSRRTTATVVSFNPQQMDLKMLRRVPEERVSAVFGVPAIVAGLGAGLDRSTFQNYSEAREAAYESNIIPTQRLLAAEIRTQLLPDFGDATRSRVRIDFDLSNVRVLQEDQDKLHTRAREDLKAGGITLNQFLEMIGKEPDPNGDVRYIPISVSVLQAGDLAEPPAPAMPPGAPPKMLPLPRTKRGSTERIGEAITRLRNRLQPSAERDIARLFAQQLERVVARLTGTSKAAGDSVPRPEEMLRPDEAARLREALEAIQLRMLQGVHGLVQDALGISFDLDDPTTRAFLAEASADIDGIHQSTLEAVRAALIAGQTEGESLSQLAARLRDLPQFDRTRAAVVARTELARASNLAAAHSYRASGVVVGVRVLDGDYDQPCQDMDGRVFSIDDLPPPLEHPNCVRAFTPLTDPADLEVAA